MSKPLISIITPFKNTSLFLKECLDSIVMQSYSNWELLIVDDHSTDNSYAIVDQYSKRDERIKLFQNNGQGIIKALQLGFSKSSGDYITRMDSDDIMHPKKLELMLNDLQASGKKHIALGLVKYFSETGISEGYANYESWLNKLTSSGTNYSEIFKECVIASPCWMLHREDFITCEGFEPELYPEDYDLAFRFYKYGIKCIPSNNLLHYWRDYSHRTSRTHEHYAANHFLDIKMKYYLELNYESDRPLTLWGAGQKGKYTAKLLKDNQIDFFWICDNPNKIGKDIYDIPLYKFDHLKQLDNPQSIITVANSDEQERIRQYFNGINMRSMKDYFFFC